jgi:hypothetical protein
MRYVVIFLLLASLTGVSAAPGLNPEHMSSPSAERKTQILQMASGLTNGMPEQVTNVILTNQGFRCRASVWDANGRTNYYEFTYGWFEAHCKDGFLIAANLRWYIPLRLNIQLPDGWRQVTNTGYADSDINGGNFAVFQSGRSDDALTINWSESNGPIKSSPDELKDAVVRFGLRNPSGNLSNSNELLNASSGSCSLGSYGTAIFRSAAFPRSQIWLMTDEKYYSIEGIYKCSKEPDPAEVREVQNMMSTVMVGPEGPK